MRFFKGKVNDSKQQEGPVKPFLERITDQVSLDPRIAPLETASFVTITTFEQTMREVIRNADPQIEMTLAQSFELFVEGLAFVLHFVQRTALQESGETARAVLQDYLTYRLIAGKLEHGIKTSATTDLGEHQKWLSNAFSAPLQDVEDIDLDLGECTILASKSPLDDATVFGRVARRVAGKFDLENDPAVRMAGWTACIESLASTKLKQQIELVINSLA